MMKDILVIYASIASKFSFGFENKSRLITSTQSLIIDDQQDNDDSLMLIDKVISIGSD